MAKKIIVIVQTITVMIVLVAIKVYGQQQPQQQHQCEFIIQEDLEKCSKEKETPSSTRKDRLCMEPVLPTCRRNYHMSIIDTPPFSVTIERRLRTMFQHCCGACVNANKAQVHLISEFNAKAGTRSHFIFPVIGSASVHRMYGYHFIPFLDTPPAFFVTKAQTSNEVLMKMLKGLVELWPLLLIALILAILAGFVAWLLDTWVNRDQFPRSFVLGLFEGFWWSFISMTTVGYGDKTPKCWTTRLFSIVWILIGLTVLSMVTASLTNIIMIADEDPSTDMNGKTIGTLMYRKYDALVVAKHGGNLRTVNGTDVHSGIDTLVERLFSSSDNHLDGFLLDSHTYYFYQSTGKGKNIDRLKTGTMHSQKMINEDKLSYGVLVNNASDYNFFHKYITDNILEFNMCQSLHVNNMVNTYKDYGKVRMFSSRNGVFFPFVKFGGIALAGIALFGCVYEVIKRSWTK